MCSDPDRGTHYVDSFDEYGVAILVGGGRERKMQ